MKTTSYKGEAAINQELADIEKIANELYTTEAIEKLANITKEDIAKIQEKLKNNQELTKEEFDQTINHSEEYTDLLNGCYIKIESDSNVWIAIQYRYDIDVQIHTNFSEDNISKIKDYFPYEKIIAFGLIDGSPVQLEY